jgi:4-amino-4-deoxychorismate lyase
MATGREIVVTLDGRLIAAEQSVLGVDDPMFSRGDGIFETVLVRDGRPCLLESHLDRLGRSAAIVGQPLPDVARWRSAAVAACGHWAGTGEAVLRLVCGRSMGFVTVSELPSRALVSRRDGVSAMTLDRGVPATPPSWSLAGAKSLSYAVNAAALRHAERLGVGDVVFTGDGGVVLEGPRSSVVIVDERGALATPPSSLPILPGITVDALFSVAAARGLQCGERTFGIADLVAAQGVWLLSSVTLAARVHTLDGRPMRAATDAFDMAALVDEAVAGPC